jgi:hypothetical protein
MRESHQAAMKELAHARRRFADYARTRLSLPAVDLFAQIDEPSAQAQITSAELATTDPSP